MVTDCHLDLERVCIALHPRIGRRSGSVVCKYCLGLEYRFLPQREDDSDFRSFCDGCGKRYPRTEEQ